MEWSLALQGLRTYACTCSTTIDEEPNDFESSNLRFQVQGSLEILRLRIHICSAINEEQ